MPTLLAVLRVLFEHADVDTGRNIAVAYATVADQLGVCAKTIQRAARVGEDLGLLTRVLDGADMSLDQRIVVLGHFARGTPGAKWRSLPNFYAATMPRPIAELIAPTRTPKPVRGSDYARSVDNAAPPPVHSDVGSMGNVRLPVGPADPLAAAVSPYSGRTTFSGGCGQLPPLTEPVATTTAARRTTAPRGTGSQRRPAHTDPAVERFARSLRESLLGYRAVSLRRICPALSVYVNAGLAPSDIQRGLDRYLAATGRTWLTNWAPHQQAEQARYLVGTITAARRAGWITAGP